MREAFARNKVLSLLVLVLLVTNILLLVFFVWKKPEPRQAAFKKDGRGDVMQILEKEVGFDEKQMEQYKQLKDQHWDKMRPYFGEMRTARNNFYKLLNLPSVPDSVVNNAADTIAAKQKKMDLQTFHHFQQVKAICTPEQQPRFDSLVQQVIKRMAGPRRSQSKEDSTKQGP